MTKFLRTLLACVAIAVATTATNAAPAPRGFAAALAEALGGGAASVDNTAGQITPKKPK